MLDGKFEISNSHDLETLRFHANGSPLLNQKIKIIVQENILNVEHLFDILTLVKKSGAHHLKLDFSQMSSPSMNEDLINLLIQQISKLNELQKLSIKHGKLNLTQATLLVEALPKNITSLDFNYHHFDLRNERDTRDFFKALSNSSIDDFTFGQTLVSDDNLSAIAANLSLFSRQFHFTLRPGNRITKMGYEILYNIKKHNPYIFASIKDKLSRSDSHFSNSPLPNVPSLFLLSLRAFLKTPDSHYLPPSLSTLLMETPKSYVQLFRFKNIKRAYQLGAISDTEAITQALRTMKL